VTDLPFSPIDIVVLALVGFAAWSGYRAGFVATSYSLASWILAAAAAIAFEGPVAKALDVFVRLPKQLETTIAFVGIIAVVEMLFAATGYAAVRPIVAALRKSSLNLIDRTLGIIPSVGRTFFIVAVLVLAIEALPVSSEIKAAVEDSRTARIVNDQVQTYQADRFSSRSSARRTPKSSTSPTGSRSRPMPSRRASFSVWSIRNARSAGSPRSCGTTVSCRSRALTRKRCSSSSTSDISHRSPDRRSIA